MLDKDINCFTKFFIKPIVPVIFATLLFPELPTSPFLTEEIKTCGSLTGHEIQRILNIFPFSKNLDNTIINASKVQPNSFSLNSALLSIMKKMVVSIHLTVCLSLDWNYFSSDQFVHRQETKSMKYILQQNPSFTNSDFSDHLRNAALFRHSQNDIYFFFYLFFFFFWVPVILGKTRETTGGRKWWVSLENHLPWQRRFSSNA